MNIIAKYILLPLLREKEKSFNKSLASLEKNNKALEKQVSQLSEKLEELSAKIEKNNRSTEALLSFYNKNRAELNSKYRAAVDALYKINNKFILNVPAFGRIKKLDIIHLLIQFLYNPSHELETEIRSAIVNDEKASKIFSEILEFNTNHKPNFEYYLSTLNLKWNDCILFPNEFVYNPSIMQPFNGEIEDGTPVYVVSLGLKLPNSNAEACLPQVFKQNYNL